MSLAGKKIVKLEVHHGQKSSSTNSKTHKRGKSSGLEFKLDELRKELASLDGGIFPHSVLSTQQISMLSSKKPKSMEEVQLLIFYYLFDFYMRYVPFYSFLFLFFWRFGGVWGVGGSMPAMFLEIANYASVRYSIEVS